MLKLILSLALLSLIFWIVFYEVTGKERHEVFKYAGRLFLVVICAAILLFIGASFLGAINGRI